MPKGSSELRTATILVEHLNSHGAQWAPPHLYAGDREVAVDAVAEGETTLLLIQLTTRTEVWSRVAREGRVERSYPDVARAIEAIRIAVDNKKMFSELGEVVLALDTTQPTVRHAGSCQGISRPLRRRAKGIGYQAIWIVGPAADLVHRIDE